MILGNVCVDACFVLFLTVVWGWLRSELVLRTYLLKRKRKDCIAVHFSEKPSFLVWIKK